MPSPLTELDREQILADLTEAHNAISKLLSDLRSRYSAKSPVLKAAAKAERDLFHLKREILKLDLREALTGPRTLRTHRPFGAVFSSPSCQGEMERGSLAAVELDLGTGFYRRR